MTAHKDPASDRQNWSCTDWLLEARDHLRNGQHEKARTCVRLSYQKATTDLEREDAFQAMDWIVAGLSHRGAKRRRTWMLADHDLNDRAKGQYDERQARWRKGRSAS
jgi:hypothetical protein